MLPGIKGIMLIIVLVFLQIFFLIGTYGHFMVARTLKLNRDLLQHDAQRTMAMKLLSELEDRLLVGSPYCVMPIIPSSELFKKKKIWWEENACSGILTGNQYYYVVEAMEKDVCGEITKSDSGQKVIAEYYRLTLFYG